MNHEILIEVKQLSRHYPLGGALFGNALFSRALFGSALFGSAPSGENRDSITKDRSIAVDNISFTLRRGEVLGFLGPNGAGKSTTMKMLTGNLAPTHGSIKIAGIDLMDQPIKAKAKIGYLPDTPPLYKDLSVDEYLCYCAQLNRVKKSQLKAAMKTAKQRCGLADYGARIINNLSKGYQQRVGIAQAIIHAPDIVILDEPTVGLDPIQMVEIRKLIKELGQSHSVMISSHILPEIQAICDTVQIINQGKLVFNASIEQLKQHMQTQTLRMSCTKAVDLDKLAQIEGVHKIEQQHNSYILHCHDSHQEASLEAVSNSELEKNQAHIIVIAQQIIQLATQSQWGLYEIFSEKQSLESVFMSLTSHDSSIQNIDKKRDKKNLGGSID